MSIRHQFVNLKSDPGDATLVRPSDWNEAHDVTGTLLDEGTSFPGSPVTGQKKYRTDLNMGFVYDGTRWVCVCPHVLPSLMDVAGFISATTTARGSLPLLSTDTGLWLEKYYMRFFISGGTALSASHKWVGLDAYGTTFLSIDSGALSAWREAKYDRNNVWASVIFPNDWTWTKTGTPGDILMLGHLTFRYIAS